MANYALSGEAVIDYATAVTTLPLFDGTGWNATACADCGVTVDRMPRVETFGVGVGQVRGTGAVLAVVPSMPCANRSWPAPTATATCWCYAAPP